MEKAQHTEGEWQVLDNHPVFTDGIIIAVHDKENSNSFRNKYKGICEMLQIRGDSFTDNSKDTEANAAHIVKCVNAHDELVAALKAFNDFADRVMAPEDYVSAMRRNAKEILNKVGAFEK